MKDIRIDVTSEDIDCLLAKAIELEDKNDLDTAVSLYKIAVKLGDCTAMTRLADILSDPPNFFNIPLAEELYRKACMAGHAPACRNVAIMFNHLGKSDLYSKFMERAKILGDVWQDDD